MDPSGEFREVALKYLDSLHNYGRILARNEPDADDLLQETLLRAFKSFGTWDRARSAKVWLLKIMKNTHIDGYRRRRSRPPEEDLPADAGEPSPVNPEEILLRRLAIGEVREAIRRLPGIWREAVELRDIEGLSYGEIAEILGTPVGTVMSRLYRGRNLLRSFLQEQPDRPVHPRSHDAL